MGEVFRKGQLVQFNDNWKRREKYKNYDRMEVHNDHIQVVIEIKEHNDHSHAYKLMCTEDGYVDWNDTHESWLEPVEFWEDING